MSKPTIITLVPIPTEIPSYKYIIENYNLINLTLTNSNEIAKTLSKSPFNEAIAIYGSYPGFFPIGGLSIELLEKLPKSLKVIGLCSAGFDGYPLNQMKSKNIRLTHVPTGLAQGDVADCVIWHLLSGIRKFNSWQNKIEKLKGTTYEVRRELSGQNNQGFIFGHIVNKKPVRRISGLNAVILGYGGIGKETAKRLISMGVNVTGVVRNPQKYATGINKSGVAIDQLGVQLLSTSELEKSCTGKDILILCLPGTENTKNIVDKNLINSLNDNCIIINVGRGSLINVEDLKVAFESGKVDHVGLDVFATEPTIDEYWIDEGSWGTTSLTPHIGVATGESYFQACETCMQNILNGIENDSWSNVVNW
ncbi:putative hydroxyacid dehydrogenase [Martiniozyma asiatica (nom. inval.)]|nr:putative hydroxyacid dehydrogenase [Martiniozyma asiatica]